MSSLENSYRNTQHNTDSDNSQQDNNLEKDSKLNGHESSSSTTSILHSHPSRVNELTNGSFSSRTIAIKNDDHILLYRDETIDSENNNDNNNHSMDHGDDIRNKSNNGGSRKQRRGYSLAKRMQKVSQRAALASKRKIWDTNDASIDAAQSAVDKWEASYHTFRSFLINTSKSALGIYNASKAATHKIEHSFFVPVRDYIILPTFSGVERVVDGSVQFLQSNEAVALANTSFQMVKHTPLVGETILAPAILGSMNFIKTSWEIAQYPIPSRENVRHSVDTVMTATKWLISTSSREISFYAKIVDATVTRTLSHTQWRVLGSGPYSTLNEIHKQEVIDHLCERYFNLKNDVARYELASHIRTQNKNLYHDLVVSGLLSERGKCLTNMIEDTWLSQIPDYIKNEFYPLLIPSSDISSSSTNERNSVAALWFYLPNHNGKKPGKDARWIMFNNRDRYQIEDHFINFLTNEKEGDQQIISKGKDVNQPITIPIQKESNDVPDSIQIEPTDKNNVSDCSTISSWYEPNANHDLLVDQSRYAISFFKCCPYCRESCPQQNPESTLPCLNPPSPTLEVVCQSCRQLPNYASNSSTYHGLWHPVNILMRPTLWRFYGPGNEVRRGVWFMDTNNSLQPYNDESAAVLEDAFLFLKWKKSQSESSSSSSSESNDVGFDNVLLTVQVMSPDESETQLVQFRALNQVTAISKTLGGGFSLFKKRVYRGAHVKSHSRMSNSNIDDCNASESFEDVGMDHSSSLDDTLVQDEIKDEYLAAPEEVKPSNPMDESDCVADHLVLVVHGICEQLRSSDLFGLRIPGLSHTLVECCDSLRNNHMEVLTTNQNSQEQENGRVEYLPVEWHEAFALQSRRSPATKDTESSAAAILDDISLKTIPHLRNFANDTMLDILFFMSPRYHNLMIEIVCKELNAVVEKYSNLTGFKGKISILAHSLGSVISWDLLSHQKNRIHEYNPSVPPVFPCSPNGIDGEFEDYPQLNFSVGNFFMIGSPVSVFLMIRNQLQPIPEGYSLPGCPRVFNIFHPYDPASYRIEPLLDKRNATAEPQIITHWKGGFRVQYQTQMLWKKFIDESRKTGKDVMKAVEAGIEGIGLLDRNLNDVIEEEDDDASMLSEDSNFQVVCTGNLCEGRRVDYKLQEKEIEITNEHLFALAAHSSYWFEKDLSAFIARHLVHGAPVNESIQLVVCEK